MNELPRLLEQSDDDFERALLGSALAERPRAAGLRDAALAIGLTVSAADATAASLPASLGTAGVAAPGAAATTPLGAAGTAGAASVTATVLGKGVLGGALVTLLGLTAVDHFVPATSPQPTPVLVAAQKPAAAADAKKSPSAKALPSPAFEVDQLAPQTPEPKPVSAGRQPLPAPEPAAVSAPHSTAPTNAAFAPIELPAPSSPAVVESPSLAAEIRQLDRARAALAVGDATTARQALDQYAANRPSPTLAHEAALLRQALRNLTHAP